MKAQGVVRKLHRILRSAVRSHLINGNDCVAGNLSGAARREEREYPDGSLNDEQRRRSAKDRATLRADFCRAAGFVAPQSQSALAMPSRRALPAARQKFSAPVPIYEMASRGVQLETRSAAHQQPERIQFSQATHA
jgi:hypothetical protein